MDKDATIAFERGGERPKPLSEPRHDVKESRDGRRDEVQQRRN
jgi:hypothetical protein